MAGYAVVDVETTGFNPPSAEIVEIAVVQTDSTGRITDRWDSLIRPWRAVSGTRVHGITAAMVRGAPRFNDIAHEIHGRLAGRVVVAHNLPFDSRFLIAELGGAALPVPHVSSGVCTLRLARRYLPGPTFKLPDCCRHAKIPLTDAHAALGDATATAKLLGYFISKGVQPGGQQVPGHITVPRPRSHAQPLSRASGR
jgi:DNA polymerase III subunit epsilon